VESGGLEAESQLQIDSGEEGGLLHISLEGVIPVGVLVILNFIIRGFFLEGGSIMFYD
jgi:hypothetical protein